MGGVLSSSARELPDLPTTVIRTGGGHKLGNLAIIIIVHMDISLSSLFLKLRFSIIRGSDELKEKRGKLNMRWMKVGILPIHDGFKW